MGCLGLLKERESQLWMSSLQQLVNSQSNKDSKREKQMAHTAAQTCSAVRSVSNSNSNSNTNNNNSGTAGNGTSGNSVTTTTPAPPSPSASLVHSPIPIDPLDFRRPSDIQSLKL